MLGVNDTSFLPDVQNGWKIIKTSANVGRFRENASQRGNGSTAVAGTVALAIRFLAKRQFLTPKIGSEMKGASARDGIGEPEITAFLDDIPGVNKYTVAAQLANLKASGDYASAPASTPDSNLMQPSQCVAQVQQALVA